MAKLKCPNCGQKYTGKFCPNCGEPAPEGAKTKGGWVKIAVIVVLILVLLVACFGGGEESEQSNSTTTQPSASENSSSDAEATSSSEGTAGQEAPAVSEAAPEPEAEPFVVYDQDGILIQITGCEVDTIFDSVELSVYIENNTEQNIAVDLDGSPAIDGFVMDGGWFYEEVDAGKKDRATFSIYNLKENGVEAKTAENLTFKLDVYDSDTYKKIVENLEVSYPLS